ncbi:hypothetical protein SCB49_05485 [unidentified eubacterium SCB49]|nr:hypothetical protein SCB49_05485 [unidentified eubacterium SCB49]
MKTKLFLFTFLILLGFYPVIGQESQNTVLSKFESGNYTVYKINGKKFEKVKKAWPVVITKSGENVSEILVKRAGILDESFKPDVPGYPAYFAFKTFRLSFIKDYAVYYEWNGKQEANTKYVLVKPGGSFGKKWEATNEEVASYAIATFKNQTNARANVKEAKAALAESDRIANSLQHKKVKSIALEIINTPKKIAHFSEAIDYGIIATLADGSQLKTSNLGGKMPWEDFKLSHTGVSNTIERVKVDENASSLKNDEVVFSVQSVYHPSLKASKSLATTNNVSIQVNQNGFAGWDRKKHMTVFQGKDGQHAGRADNLTVKVKSFKHKQTGATLNKIEVYNNTKNKIVSQYKLTPDTEFIVNAIGGYGMGGFDGDSSTADGGNGGNGGAGGNVTVIKDPNVKKVTLKINNQGGKGGKGGAPKYSSASAGRTGSTGENGTTTTQTKTLQLNF